MKRPWNLPNMPVYSLATYNTDNVVNMNICTYVSAVSMKPKRYMIAVYHNTQTLNNLMANKTSVLQLLSTNHVSLVAALGKKSGQHWNKQSYLTKRKHLTEWNGFSVLTNCAALVALTKIWSKDAGDHTMFLFDANRFITNHDDILMLDDLRTKKLIRI